jgi:hypothetical protein
MWHIIYMHWTVSPEEYCLQAKYVDVNKGYNCADGKDCIDAHMWLRTTGYLTKKSAKRKT